MRMVLIALGCLGLAAAGASAQVDDYTCYKAKDLKQPQFAGSTAGSVSDEFDIASEAAVKRPFLYCAPTALRGSSVMNPTTKLTCYKVRGIEASRANGTVDGTANESMQRKTYVLCVPATES